MTSHAEERKSVPNLLKENSLTLYFGDHLIDMVVKVMSLFFVATFPQQPDCLLYMTFTLFSSLTIAIITAVCTTRPFDQT